jgi:hypothetical protein
VLSSKKVQSFPSGLIHGVSLQRPVRYEGY